MNPHQKNKIDIGQLSADEQRLFRLYGKLPNKKDLLQNKLKERKYFDSGDYAMSKAGKASDSGITTMGTEHPRADDIPHMSPLTNTISRGDSISAGSPPSNPNNPLFSDNPPILPGAGMHRGSINGIPGAGLPGMSASRSPVKESSYLARSSSVHESNQDPSGANQNTTSTENDNPTDTKEPSMSPPLRKEGIPIRR